MKKVKLRFLHQPEVYTNFLEVLQSYQRDVLSLHEVYLKMADLLKGHHDLLEGFQEFLPNPSSTNPIQLYSKL